MNNRKILKRFSDCNFVGYIDMRSSKNGESEYGYAFYTIVTTSSITEYVNVYMCFEI